MKFDLKVKDASALINGCTATLAVVVLAAHDARPTVDSLPPRRPPTRVPVVAQPVGTPEPFPTRIAPVNAQDAEKPFNHAYWTFEPNWTVTGRPRNGKVKLLTRGKHDYSSYFQQIVRDLAAQDLPPMVIDAEIAISIAGGCCLDMCAERSGTDGSRG